MASMALPSLKHAAFAAMVVLFSSGLQAQQTVTSPADEPDSTATSANSDGTLERVNKTSFAFTRFLDRNLLKPVAQTYQFIMPDPAEKAVTRVFGNIGEVVTVANDVLQGKPGQAVHDSGRVLINSTLGIAGVFEVAESMGLKKNDPEDFGQTLAVWGVGSGPYIYLPILGPSTVRDAPARVVDYFFNPVTYIDESSTRYVLNVVEQVDTALICCKPKN